MVMESSMRFGRGRGRSGGRSGGRGGIFRPIMPSFVASSYDGNRQFDVAQYYDRAEGSHEGQQPNTSEVFGGHHPLLIGLTSLWVQKLRLLIQNHPLIRHLLVMVHTPYDCVAL